MRKRFISTISLVARQTHKRLAGHCYLVALGIPQCHRSFSK
jgi:hypothetical protein